MAGSLNKVMLMGNLTRDVEVRHINGDNAVGNFGIAVNRRFRTRDGENREEVTFIDCEVWGRTAEVMAQYLGKGRPVFLEGRLKLDTWQDKTDGSNRSKLKVVVETFQFVDSRNEGGGSGGGSGRGGDSYQTAGAGHHVPVSEDDIPF
ncbi:MAG: single-stranded DNA-binding protein [Phycisphaeraceae bacterium]|nr:single-stranded DNA-binding protein [Phycisphaeraceae bacterium]MCB9848275.1 single-stranded DNA-binding protein [Phycisphaeraceae bacterium]